MATAQDIALTTHQHQILGTVLEGCDDMALPRGAVLMRERAVRSVTWVALGEVLEAKVQDEFLCTTRLCFVADSVETHCTCKAGKICQHVVALMLELRKNARRANVPTGPSQQAAAFAAPDPASLAGLVAAKLDKPLPLPKAAVDFLTATEGLWQRKIQRVEQSYLHQLCGTQSHWGHMQIELYPQDLPPQTVWEFLAYLAAAVRRCQLTLPEPLSEAVDAKLQKELLTRWDRLHEITKWRLSLGSWQDSTLTHVQEAPELRLQMYPGGVVIQVRHPGEEGYVKATQKLLKQLSTKSYAQPTPQLSAGSSIVLHAAVDSFGRIQNPEIEPMSELLNKSLTQLASSQELFHSHVIGSDGEPLHFVDEALRWELTPPTDDTGDYALRLLNEQGVAPPPPLAILRGSPLRYVTSELVYTLPYWPFGKERMKWPVSIPAAALETREGVSALGKLGVEVPQRLAGKVRLVKADIQVRCKLHRPMGTSSEYLRIKGRATFDGIQEPSDWNSSNWQANHSQRTKSDRPKDDYVQIDKSVMPAAGAWLRQLPLKVAEHLAHEIWVEQRIQGKDWPELFLAWLDRRPKGITVELDAELASLREGKVAGKVRLDIEESKNGIDWFDLTVALDVSDHSLSQEEIDLLLKAKGKWVRIVGKGWRKLDYQLSDEQLQELAELGLATNDFSPEKQQLHALQLGRLAKNTTLLTADRVEQVQRRVEEIQTRVTPAAPAVITATMRPYQLEGFHFLAYLTANRFGGVLADDMGLGKTLQALAWIAWLRGEKKVSDPVLVVCPKSVQDNWRAECAKFFPQLKVEVWNRATAGKTGLSGESDLLVIHYAQLRIHEEPIRKVQWGAVILDEAQAIKNPTSQNSRAACALIAPHRLALTGTPIENRLLDLWSIFAFAMPGVLGNRSSFTKNFDGKDDPLARRRLAARTRPFLLRRTKNEVAKDLPDRIEEDLIIELEGTQATLYQAELKRARAQLLKAETSKQLDKLRFNILTSLLRLRQICCHPRLLGLDASSKKKGDEKTDESAKVAALIELLEPLMEEGQKVLVFSQFVEMLAIIEAEMQERGWTTFKLTGQTEERGALVDSFQSHAGSAVFLISLKAGGFGLNLTAASYVVLFDPWWNPAVEAQAIDRTHRIGQKQTVFAYRLLIKGTIEEKIRLLQKQKGAIANDILGEENFAKALTLDDFHFLLGEE